MVLPAFARYVGCDIDVALSAARMKHTSGIDHSDWYDLLNLLFQKARNWTKEGKKKKWGYTSAFITNIICAMFDIEMFLLNFPLVLDFLVRKVYKKMEDERPMVLLCVQQLVMVSVITLYISGNDMCIA